MKPQTGIETTNPAGLGFGELSREDLVEDRAAVMASSGYICTLTWECNC
ncbi:hypothetical protein JOF53_003189 [Crossiella equi]|uniref:Uncharacterized protein n=1 Tax=Crossiella equi TaxID=130796 RepID=A0ABS5ADH2_9PSEU|nr:hypothetical protein [Crossiella equi]MBP2474317.1 hypothetical protein [Crossiella equi]